MRNGEIKYVLMQEVILHCRNNVTTEKITTKKMYASMVRMSDNGKFPNRNFGDSLKYTNWVLAPGATCHMTPQDSDFIPR